MMTVRPCFAENAMITEDDGTCVRFHPVCPQCKKVMYNITGMGYCRNGISSLGYYSCYNGCPQFQVILHRG